MSGFILGNEGLTNLPEADQIAAQKEANRQTLINLNSRLSMPITSLKNDPRLTDITGGPSALNSIPGAGLLEWPAGMAASVADALGTVRNAITGHNSDWHVPGLPTMRKMGENFEQTRQEVMQGVAEHTPLVAPDPTKPMDDLNDQLASLSGVGIPIAPAIVGRAIEKLPAVARHIAQFVVPTTTGAPGHMAKADVLAPVLTGVNEAGAMLDEHNAAKAEAAANAATTGAPPTPPSSPTQAPPDQVAANVKPGTASDVGTTGMPSFDDAFKASQTQAPQTPSSFHDAYATTQQPVDFHDAYMQSEQTTPVPMQQGSGVGTVGIGGAIATLLGVGIGVRAGRRARERNAAVTQAGRDLRMNDPDYAAKAQDFNNQQIASGNGAISSNPNGAPAAPLPQANTVRTGLNRANNAVLDRTAQAQEIIRNLGTPTTAEALAHEYGQLHQEGSPRVKFDAFLDTGYHAATGVQMPAPDRVNRRIAALDEGRQQTLMEGLFSANEQDNRKNNRASFAQLNPGVTPKPEDIRHDAYNHDDAALQTSVQKMMADPELRAIAEDTWAQGQAWRDIGQRMGVVPRPQAIQMSNAHPHYIPETDITGKVMTPLSQRDRTKFTGVDQPIAKPWNAMTQMMEGLHHEYALREHYAKVYNSLSEAQTTHPGAAKLFTDVAPPTDKPVYYNGGDAREAVVAIHSGSGTKYVRVNNPDVYNLLTGDSLKRAQVMSEMATVPRRIYQSYTTGIGSLVSGGFAPTRNVAYSLLATPTNTPKGFNAGLIHKGIRAATGGRWDSGLARGADIATNALLTYPYTYLRGVADRRVHNVANILDKGAKNPINSFLRGRNGDIAVDNMQAALDRYYRDSVTYEMQAKRGIGGGGFGPKQELRPLGIASDKRASMAAAQHVPQLFHTGGEWMGVKPMALRLNEAVHEAMAHISDVGHEAFYRLNRDNTGVGPEALAKETRALTGDPSVGGSSKILKRVTDALPYTNITAQGGARLARSFGERPLNATMATIGGIGTLKLLSLLTAMQSPQTFQNYENELSTQEHTGQISIYLPNGSRWPIPLAQEMQPAATMLESLISNAMNVVAMKHDPITFQGAYKMLTDFFGGHISTAHVDQLKLGAANQVSPFMGHPMIGQFDPYKMMQGSGLWGSFKSPFEGGTSAIQRTLPNQIPDFMHEDVEGKDWTKLIGSIFGLAGSAVMEHVNAMPHYLNQFGNWSDALGQTGHDWLQRAGDRNPVLTPLMDHPMRMSLIPPIIERTEREMKWMDAVHGSRTEPGAEGWTGRGVGQQPVYSTGESKIPKDPTMLYMWTTIESNNKKIATQKKEISAIRKQMMSVGAEGMDVDTRRDWMNKRTRDLADKYRIIHGYVQDTNNAMSKAVGRNVQVGMHIDWQKGPEQFTDAQ